MAEQPLRMRGGHADARADAGRVLPHGAEPDIWRPRNELLGLLPREDLDRLRPMLQPVTLNGRRILFHNKAPLQHVYFMEEGLVSVLAEIEEGRAVEVWLTGREGFMGIPVILGSTGSPHRRVAQLGGRALRMGAEAMRRAMDEIPSLNRLLLRYVHAVMVQTAQVSACNSSHRLDQRLARWLLSVDDRCDREPLPLTHDMLARMLGVRRASVSDSLAALDRAGLIRTGRGHVEITDRAGLEGRSCRCYQIMTSEYERMHRDLAASLS